jgi:DNA-binding beta-propeller fold protein YncE
MTRRVGRPIVLPVEGTQSSVVLDPLWGQSYSPVQPAQFGDIAVNPDGRRACVSDGCAVIPLSFTRARALEPISGLNAPSMIAVSPDRQVAYVTNPACRKEISTRDCVVPRNRPVMEPDGKIQLYAGG